jgi:hypothetical protein
MKKTIACLSALLILFAGCAFAAESTTSAKNAASTMCANYNKLNKDQKAEVNKIIADNIDQTMPTRQKVIDNLKNLHDLMMVSPIDEKAINKVADEIGDYKKKIFMKQIQVATQISKKYGYIPPCCLTKNRCSKVIKMQKEIGMEDMDGMTMGGSSTKK